MDRSIFLRHPSVAGDSFTETTTYNQDSQFATSTQPNNLQVVSTYDDDGRLSGLTAAPAVLTYGYNYKEGILKFIKTNSHFIDQLHFEWDGFLLSNRVWKEDAVTDAYGPHVLGVVQFIYDEGFRVKELKVYDGEIPHSILYQYNVEGEPVSAGDLSINRDAATGLVTATQLGVVTGDYSYNGFGEPESSVYKQNSNPLISFAYDRDKLGRITQKSTTDKAGVTKVQVFQYDNGGRLTSETQNGQTITYSYDTDGNRLNNNAVYDAQDRLVENTDYLFFYDKSGFLAEKRRKSNNLSIYYTYDGFGQLLKVDDRINNKVVEYTVDGEGRRIAKKINAKTIGWAYKDDLKPVTESESDIYGVWHLKKIFIYGVNPYSPDAFLNLADNKTYRIIYDHLGSPRMVVDAASGEIIEEIDYDTWGNVVSDTNPGLLPFGFAGGMYDADTGLVRFGARDYDPSIGRCLDKDPIGFGGGTNWYVYVGSEPVNKIDIDGRDMIDGRGTINTNHLRSIKTKLDEKDGRIEDIADRIPLGKKTVKATKKTLEYVPLPPKNLDFGYIPSGDKKGTVFCRFSKEF